MPHQPSCLMICGVGNEAISENHTFNGETPNLTRQDETQRILTKSAPDRRSWSKTPRFDVRTFCRGGTKAKAWVDETSQSRKESKMLKPKTPLQRRQFYDRLNQVPQTSRFASSHAVINRERVMRGLSCLQRNTELDEMARSHARSMAECNKVFVSNDEVLKEVSSARRDAAIGQNVGRGSSLNHLQDKLMKFKMNRLNILDERFLYMGVGTSTDEGGRLYLCQIFRS